MRYAAYIRLSSEEQIGNYSIDAQKRAIEAWVKVQGGVLLKIYIDEGHSGRTANRPALQQMRRDARAGQFDALVVHKFDRFARNRTDALAIKSLLRQDYGVKVFSVSEPSEDSDGPIGTLIEGIMESVAEWYSQNLGTEVAKGKRERSAQGLHNNQAGFGLKKDENKLLIRDDKEISGILMAFQQYSTGRYSDGDVGHLLNAAGYRTKRGRLFSKDTVRDMLQNQTYIGKTKYQKYQRKPDGSRSYAAPVEWFDGQHEAVIDPELFHRCQVIRAQRRAHRQATARYNFYLLRNLVYCYRYGSEPPADSPFRRWGKMRCHAQSNKTRRFYRCLASSVGHRCAQKGVQVEVIDEQVVDILMALKPPAEWHQAVAKTFGDLLGEQQLGERTAEIRAIMKRMDSRWDHGFVTDVQEYQVQRRQLQQELERLTPIPDDELEQTVKVLAQFTTRWQHLDGQPEAQSELVGLIVKRVYIQDDKVAAMTLHQNYHLVLGHHLNRPTEYTVDRSSSDTSARLGLIFLPEHIAQQHFSMRPAPTQFK